jgi:hypothetical protein
MPTKGELEAAAVAIARGAPVAPSAARELARLALDAAERVRNIEDQDRKRARRRRQEQDYVA